MKGRDRYLIWAIFKLYFFVGGAYDLYFWFSFFYIIFLFIYQPIIFLHFLFIYLYILSILIYFYTFTVLIFWFIWDFPEKKTLRVSLILVFCFNDFTLYAIDFSEEGIEMVFSRVD